MKIQLMLLIIFLSITAYAQIDERIFRIDRDVRVYDKQTGETKRIRITEDVSLSPIAPQPTNSNVSTAVLERAPYYDVYTGRYTYDPYYRSPYYHPQPVVVAAPKVSESDGIIIGIVSLVLGIAALVAMQ